MEEQEGPAEPVSFSSVRSSVLKRFSKLIKPNLKASGKGLGAPQKTPDGRLVSVRYWGITREQVRQLHATCRQQPQWSDDDSVAVFVEKFVKPMTKGCGMGVSLLLNQNVPREVNLMVSHAWIENTKDFFDDIDMYMQDHEVAFICFLALYQESAQDIQAQLGTDVRNGPFADIISNVHRLGGRMLVVANEALKQNGQGLYSRMWCAWEVYCAAKSKVPIDYTHRRSGKYLTGRATCSIRDARCGNPALPMNADEEAIREAIEEEALDDRIGILGKVQFALIAWAGCCLIGPKGRFHIGGFMLGHLVFAAVFFLGYRCDRRSDGYDRVDETIERVASGGVRAMGFFRMGSSGMMNVACLLGIVADIACHLADSAALSHQAYAGSAPGAFYGMLLSAAIFLDWGTRRANLTVAATTLIGFVVGWLVTSVVAVYPSGGSQLHGPHEVLCGSLIGLCIGIGAVYFNRSQLQRFFIMSSAILGGIAGLMKATWWSTTTDMVLPMPWLQADYLSGECMPAEVQPFELWKTCFYSMLGLVLGIMATSSSHSWTKRAIRVASLFGGIVIINLLTSADFTFLGGPMLIATLSQRVGIAATRVSSVTSQQQILVVTMFLFGSSMGALICNTGGCLLGGVIGNLIGVVLSRMVGQGPESSSSERFTENLMGFDSRPSVGGRASVADILAPASRPSVGGRPSMAAALREDVQLAEIELAAMGPISFLLNSTVCASRPTADPDVVSTAAGPFRW